MLAGIALALTACQAEPRQNPLDDHELIAKVTQDTQVEMIAPQPLAPADFAQMEDTGSSCAFYSQEHALMLARPNFGWVKLDGQLQRLVAKGGAGPLGTRSHYQAGDLVFQLIPSGAATVTGQPRQTMPAQIEARNGRGETVFGVAGYMRCALQ